MNLRKRTTVAHRTRPHGRDWLWLTVCLSFAGAAYFGWVISLRQMVPIVPAVPDIPEGVLVMRHGTQIERYVSAEPTILCPDGTVRPMSNYRHVCEPGWRQP